MNVAPEFFTRDRRSAHIRVPRRVPRMTDPREEMLAPADAAERYVGERREQRFWQWFAAGVLLFCWIAEASMCAARGF